MSIQASAPGKLYIAGEYAVVHPGNEAVITSTPQRLTVTIKESSHTGLIHSQLMNGLPLQWYRRGGDLVIDERENPYHLIIAALKVVEGYVKEKGISVRYYHLDVSSDLNNSDGVKYGLGSSGAVTIATIKAVLAFYGLKQEAKDPMFVYKCGVITHMQSGNNGSYGDLACSAFEGVIHYTSPNRQTIRTWLEEGLSLSSILTELEWPHLAIQPVLIHPSLRLIVGWTGEPVSTAQQLDNLNAPDDLKVQDMPLNLFSSLSNNLVRDLLPALASGNLTRLRFVLEDCRQLLIRYTTLHRISFETPKLKELVQLSKKEHLPSKSSGAGGGDCGITFTHRLTTAVNNRLISALKATEIIILPFEWEGAYNA